MVTTTRHKSISTLYSSCTQHGKYTSSHFQGTGYGTSSSSVRILFILVPLLCESMFADMYLGRTLPPWHAFLFDITPHSIQPSYLRPSSLPYISIVIHPTPCSSLLIICPYQFRILSWTSIAISPTFGASIPYSSIPYHVELCDFAYHHSHFFYCAFCNVLPRYYHCHVQLPLGTSRSFSVTQHSTDSLPVLPTVLHAEGVFGIQFSIFL